MPPRSPEFLNRSRREALEKMDPQALEQSLPQVRDQNRDMLEQLKRTIELLKQLKNEEQLDALAKRPDVDEIDPSWDKARQSRHAYAPGRCREIMRQVFGDRRALVVPAKMNTLKCAECNRKLTVNPAQVTAHCRTCGPKDQDVNNCVNLLRRAQDGEGAPPGAGNRD